MWTTVSGIALECDEFGGSSPCGACGSRRPVLFGEIEPDFIVVITAVPPVLCCNNVPHRNLSFPSIRKPQNMRARNLGSILHRIPLARRPHCRLNASGTASCSAKPSTGTNPSSSEVPILTTSPPAPQHLPDVPPLSPAQKPSAPESAPNNSRFFLVAFVSILITPPIMYFYYEHRREHMGKKKEALIQQIEARRKAYLAERS